MQTRNARFLANGWIDCEIDHPLWGWIPFTANPEDAGAGFDVGALHRAMIAGGAVAPFVPPSADEARAALAAEMRALRDHLLRSEVDPIVTNPLRWADLLPEAQAEWVAYRRALLDLPEAKGFPERVLWPPIPAR
jgi:hypothetical protein